jgi:hypothetical protein
MKKTTVQKTLELLVIQFNQEIIQRLEEMGIGEYIVGSEYETGTLNGVHLKFVSEHLREVFSLPNATLPIWIKPVPGAMTQVILPNLYKCCNDELKKRIFGVLLATNFDICGIRWSFDKEDGELRAQFDLLGDGVPSLNTLSTVFSIIDNVIPFILAKISCVENEQEISQNLHAVVIKNNSEAVLQNLDNWEVASVSGSESE